MNMKPWIWQHEYDMNMTRWQHEYYNRNMQIWICQNESDIMNDNEYDNMNMAIGIRQYE